MPNRELALYTVHGLFWTSFGLTRVILRLLDAAYREYRARTWRFVPGVY